MDIKQDNLIGFKDHQLSSSYSTDTGNVIKPQCDISLSFYTVGSTQPSTMATITPENKFMNSGKRLNEAADHQPYVTETNLQSSNFFTTKSSGNTNSNTDSSKIFDKSFYKDILIDSSPRLLLNSQSDRLDHHRRSSEMQLTSSNKQFLNDETRQAVENIRGTMAAIADRRILFFSESPKSPLLSPSSRLSYEFENSNKKCETSPLEFCTSYNKLPKDINNSLKEVKILQQEKPIDLLHKIDKDIDNQKQFSKTSFMISNSTDSTFNDLITNNHAKSQSSKNLVESSIPVVKPSDTNILSTFSTVELSNQKAKPSIPTDLNAVKLNSSDSAMYLRHLSFPKHSDTLISPNFENTSPAALNFSHQSPDIKFYSVPEGASFFSGDVQKNSQNSTNLWTASKSGDSEKVFFSDLILNEEPISNESKSIKLKKSSKQNSKIQSPVSKPKKVTGEKEGGGGHKESWKGKVARTIMRYGSGTILSSADPTSSPVINTRLREVTGVIGIPLEYCEPSPNNPFVPFFVAVCTKVVEERGLDYLGIYRVPGNTGAIKELQDEINKDPKGLCLHNEKWQDVNLVTSLLKLFLRRLPDSLITDELYESTINANKTENAEKRMLRLKKILHELPDHNFNTLHHLAHHLTIVAAHEENNKMDMHNLAIMFGPTLIRPRDNNLVAMAKNMADQCRIIETILSHCDWFFSSWDEDVNVPIDEESDDVPPISHINDQMVAKAQSLAASNNTNSASAHISNLSTRHLSFTNFSSLRTSAKSRFRPKANTLGSECKQNHEPMRSNYNVNPEVEVDVKFVYRPAFNKSQPSSLKPFIYHASSFDELNCSPPIGITTHTSSKPV